MNLFSCRIWLSNTDHVLHVTSAANKQDKLSFALERVELQTEEATLFQRQTNDKILLIKVFKIFVWVFF